MGKKDMIYIPEQFSKASEFGFTRRHNELAKKLSGLFERADSKKEAGLTGGLQEYWKDDLFHKTCKDVARDILLSKEPITSIPVSEAQGMVEELYVTYLNNPDLAGNTRQVSVH